MLAESSHPHGEVFLDTRGAGRALRLTWHHEADVVVLSLWRDQVCAGTFRLAKADVGAFIDALVEGLRDPGQPEAPEAHVPQTGEVQVTEHTIPPARPASECFTDWAFDDDPTRASA